MNPAEAKACALVKLLQEHCRKERLPLLVLVGLVEAKSMARAWCDQSGQSREIFMQTAHELLRPDSN